MSRVAIRIASHLYSRLRSTTWQLRFALLALSIGSFTVIEVRSQTFTLASAIAFVSTRDTPNATGLAQFPAAELYVMRVTAEGLPVSPDAAQRLTSNDQADIFPHLSPLGKQLAFESNRYRGDLPLQVADLFLMNLDDHDDTSSVVPDEKHILLTRGGSLTWSPDGRRVAFQASASGDYTAFNLARFDPGTPALDSDIFVMNVDECIAHAEECIAKQKAGDPTALPDFMTNITRLLWPVSVIDEDPDWSPDGTLIAFTSHDGEKGTYLDGQGHNNFHAEVYVVNVDSPNAEGALQQVTDQLGEERAPAWSANGRLLLYMCRRGGVTPFQLCVSEKNAQGVWVETQLTDNGLQHLGAEWSPDPNHPYILFQRNIAGRLQMFRATFGVNEQGAYAATEETQLTTTPGVNGFMDWGMIRTKIPR